ncbi:unnamed protein product [Effrenium voratum]|nr:unnamed protein product [Effrenium voratum]
MADGKSKMAPDPRWIPLPRLAKRDMHDAGLCVPCLYFTSKADGCRKGDACSHCHFCTKQDASRRRRHLRANGLKAKAEVEQEEMKLVLQAKALPRDTQELTSLMYWL